MASIPWIGPKPTLVKTTESTISCLGSDEYTSANPKSHPSPSARRASASAAVATVVSTNGDDYSRFQQSGIPGFEFRLPHQNLLPVRGVN
ncbi:hypothetical protein AKJ16_DCAP19456 [Drosera capensis]